MLIESSQNLKFQCGPYGLLIDIAYVSAIEDYDENMKKESATKISWNDIELLFVDF